MGSRDQLIGICTSTVSDRNSFSAPDEFRPATSEPLPPAKRVSGRIAVWRSVPSLHRLDCDAITNVRFAFDQRPAKRRIAAGRKLAIARNGEIQSIQLIPKGVRPLDTSQPRNRWLVHAVRRRSGKASTASTPSKAKTMRAMQLAK